MAWPPLTKNFIIVAIGLFVIQFIYVLFEPFKTLATSTLLLTSQTYPQVELWALLSYGFISTNFGQLFFDVMALYIFGAEIDRVWSTKKWWLTSIVAIIVGGILGALILWIQGVGGVIGGFGAPIMAMIAAYCWSSWQKPINFFFVELTGKVLLGLFVGLDIILAIWAFVSGRPSMLGLHLGGLLVGLLVVTDLWKPKRLILHYKYRKVRKNMKLVAKTPEQDTRKRKDGTWIN